MTTPLSCRGGGHRLRTCATVGVLLWSATGCGITQGKFLYMFGLFRGKKVEAQFRLTRGPVLILVDDQSNVVDWPIALRLLQDDLAQELLRTDSAKKIVPVQTIQALRQTEPDFDRRGMREIGRLAGAEQVLWIGVDDFFVSEEAHEIHDAAYFVASVKVINALEEERAQVRLWPDSPEGHRVVAQASAGEVTKAGTKDKVSKLLTARLSEIIAKLFHDYRLGDFEDEE